VQRHAFQIIQKLNIFHDFAGYTPLLCGTIPLAIDVEGSDLDIIMEVRDFERFKHEVQSCYGKLDEFTLNEMAVQGTTTVLCNFTFEGMDFELFAQPIPVVKQNAYRHMIIEHHLLMTHPHIKDEIINLKKQGLKTEPAFAKVLGLAGDPYEELLKIGSRLDLI
jgi:predicted metallo-beta-lactamase superfamily hydrolase